MPIDIRRVIAVGLTLGSLLVLNLPRYPYANGVAAAAEGDRVAAVVQAYTASSQRLFARLATTPGNIAFSPYSIGTAMAMVLAGARGDTAAEMSRVLMHRLSSPEIGEANRMLMAALNANDRSARLLTANALVRTQRGDLVSMDYADLLHAKYAAELFQNATLDDINDWVKGKTEGRIDRMLDRLPADSAAVILNAIYFKARWASVFERNVTKDEPFNLTASRQVSLPTMMQTNEFAVAGGSGYRALRLPYEDASLGMIIVLPSRIDGIAQVENVVDAKELERLFGSLRSPQARKAVALSLPRFNVTFKTNLVPAFQQIGMSKSFSDAANFSGMSARSASPVAMKIGQIVHRAVVEVGEKGTEAAAATAVEVRALAMRPPRTQPTPEPFRVDHPFLFYVVDDRTGAILFEGRVADPRSEAGKTGP